MENAPVFRLRLLLGTSEGRQPIHGGNGSANKLRKQSLHTGVGIEDVAEHAGGFCDGANVGPPIPFQGKPPVRKIAGAMADRGGLLDHLLASVCE